MAKVNKKPFHCIPLAVFTDNGHSTLSPNFERRKKQAPRSNQLGQFQAPDRKWAHESRNRDGSFIKDHLRFIFCSPLQPSPHLLPRVLSPSSESLHVLSAFPSDVPGGFSVIQGAEPTEGGHLNLTCIANRHLYTALSWRRLHHRESPRSSHQPTSGPYSNFLVLSISNLTAGHSGVYRCSARHRVSGKESHLDATVAVISEWCVCFVRSQSK